MSSAAVKARLTPEQYLASERKSSVKSEYDNGAIHAMAGASRPHNLIASNLNREIGSRLKDRPGEVYISDMRVCVSQTGLYTYPDVVAVRGEPPPTSWPSAASRISRTASSTRCSTRP